MMDWIGPAAVWLGMYTALAVAALENRRLLHMLQLEDYDLGRLWRRLRADWRRALTWDQVYAAGFLAWFGHEITSGNSWAYWLLVFGAIPCASAAWRTRRDAGAERPLVYTTKALLLTGISLALSTATLIAGAVFWLAPPTGSQVVVLFPITLAVVTLLPAVYLTLATLSLCPFGALVVGASP
jgi:hypothetical protein